MVEDLAKACALRRELPGQRPQAHAELLGDHRRPHLTAGKDAFEVVFDYTPKSPHPLPLGEEIVRVRSQNVQQVTVLGDDRQLHHALRQHPAVRGLQEFNGASQESMDLF